MIETEKTINELSPSCLRARINEQFIMKMLAPHVKFRLDELVGLVKIHDNFIANSMQIKNILDENRLILSICIDRGSEFSGWHQMKWQLHNFDGDKLDECTRREIKAY